MADSKSENIASGIIGFVVVVWIIYMVWGAPEESGRNCLSLYDKARTHADSFSVDSKHLGPFFLLPCVALTRDTTLER